MTLNHLRPARTFAGILVLAAFAALAGCSNDSTSPKRVPLSLHAQGMGAPAQNYAASRSFASLAGTAVADTDSVPVTFTRALLVVRDVRLVSDDPDGGQVLFTGPFVVDLLAGDAQHLGTKMVPAAPYTKVMGHIQSLSAGDDLAAQYPDLVGYTILLEGDIAGDGGGHFLYQERIDTEFVIHGNFVVEEDEPATSFLVFDLSQLLLSREGHFLDPRNPDNDQLIEQAIRHATKFGLDRDHDGDPDHLAEVLD